MQVSVERISSCVVRGVLVPYAEPPRVIGEEKILFDSYLMLAVVAKIVLPVVGVFEGVKQPRQPELFVHVINAGAYELNAAVIVAIDDVIDKIIIKH